MTIGISSSPAHAIEIAIVGRLKADPTVAGLVGDRVFTCIPERSAFPLLIVEGSVETPWNTLRRRGAYTSIQVRAGAQDHGTATIHATISAAKTALDGVWLDLGSAWREGFCEFETAPPVFTDVLAGVLTWYRPAVFRVYAIPVPAAS
jgi:Protein of unknown function (DUF3168)